MKVSARYAALALVAWAATYAGSASADPATIERAKAALAGGNAKQAYADLAPLQDKLSGQPEFDYLLGVAALDSARIDEAIIAFERVLALIPNHAGAHMDLAHPCAAHDLTDIRRRDRSAGENRDLVSRAAHEARERRRAFDCRGRTA